MLGDVQNFLYDINFLYEILRLAIDPNYEVSNSRTMPFFETADLLSRGSAPRREPQANVTIDIHIVINLNMALATELSLEQLL